MCTNQTPLPITFVTKEESEKREQWFNEHNFPILDALTLLQEGQHENTRFDFKDIETAIKFFKLLIEDRKDGDGVRVYIASPSGDGSVGQGKCGVLTLFFVATTGYKKQDVGPYFSFDNKKFYQISPGEAERGVHNYQLIKRKHLFKTLSDLDILNIGRETKHIWFSLTQMEQTIKEMECQRIRHSNIVNGFGIRFTSYTNEDYLFLESKTPEYKLRRRLTIYFTFIHINQKDIGLEDIDHDEFNQRLETTRDGFLGDTFDTGVPAPPPPPPTGTDNMAALDYEI